MWFCERAEHNPLQSIIHVASLPDYAQIFLRRREENYATSIISSTVLTLKSVVQMLPSFNTFVLS